MMEKSENNAGNTTLAQALPDAAPMVGNKVNAQYTAKEVPVNKKLRRTLGQLGVDIGLYPILTNAGVFFISLGATYLTVKGGDRNAAGELIHGRLGEIFHTRGEALKNQFKKFGMNESQADMSKMVFFSFVDGTFMAPFIKVIEDRREKISRWIDHKCGTTPEDLSVYKAEPKQSWTSVVGGRLATCSIVVPTAVMMEKAGLNDVLFVKPGIQIGEAIVQRPKLAKLFGKLDPRELSKIGIFELFYTSVCTGGLYMLSRTFSKKLNAKHAVAQNDATPQQVEPVYSVESTERKRAGDHLKRPPLGDLLTGFVDRQMAGDRKSISLGLS
jgi:hypothetical protein